MKNKLIILILIFLNIITIKAADATIFKIDVLESNVGSAEFYATQGDWNKNNINHKIPLARGHSYIIVVRGNFIDLSNEPIAAIEGQAPGISGITISQSTKSGVSVGSGPIEDRFPWRRFKLTISSNVTASLDFIVRFRYAVERNGKSCGGLESFCGDNVKFEIVNKGIITNIGIVPQPTRKNDVVIFELNQIYTLKFGVSGSSGIDTKVASDFLTHHNLPASSGLQFISPIISSRITNIFSVQIKCVAATLNRINVQNYLTNCFFDTNIDPIFEQDEYLDYLYYSYSPTLSNSENSYNLTNIQAGR